MAPPSRRLLAASGSRRALRRMKLLMEPTPINPHKPTGVGLVNIYQNQARTVGLGSLETALKVSQLCLKF